jgi:hypothetical protein
MSKDLKPFLMVINDETGDFVDIELIQGVVIHEGMSNILLQNNEVVFSPLKPRELWSRINVIRHKYGQQQRRSDPASPSITPEKPKPTG